MIFVKTTIAYFYIKSKINFQRIAVTANNAILLTGGFVNIYNLYKYSYKKICGQYLLPT